MTNLVDSGMIESKRDYIVDVIPENGISTAIGPYPSDVKYSIVIGDINKGNVFYFVPTKVTFGE